MKRYHHLTIWLLALALLGVLLALAAWQPKEQPPAPAAPQDTRTSRPTVVHPTRRPSLTPSRTPTPTATAFHPFPPTVTRFPTNTPRPSPTPTHPTDPPDLPSSAQVEGLEGHGQTLPLSCESRSAVDWAGFFGVSIPELEFFNRIPSSDDPEVGFVGSPYGSWGQIPPGPYGVHAEPVAGLLREYGLPASAERDMPLAKALQEIAAGRPVVVWVTGHVEPGKGVEISINGQARRVARYEHTVILIGYDDDRDVVAIQDGAKVYERSIDIFLKAWEPLGNMAVRWQGSD